MCYNQGIEIYQIQGYQWLPIFAHWWMNLF